MNYSDLIDIFRKSEPLSDIITAIVVYQALCRHHQLTSVASSTTLEEDLGHCINNYPEFSTVKPFRDYRRFSKTIDSYKDLLEYSTKIDSDENVYNMLMGWDPRGLDFYAFTDQSLTSFITSWLVEKKAPISAYCPFNNLLSVESELMNRNIPVASPQINQEQGLLKSLLSTLQPNEKLSMSLSPIEVVGRRKHQFDVGFTLPPFLSLPPGPGRSWEELCIDELLTNVSGRSAIILLSRYAFQVKPQYVDRRTQLVKNNLRAVVRLPCGFCRGTNVSPILLLLDQNAMEQPRNVLMVDLSRNDCKDNNATYRYQTSLNKYAIAELNSALAGNLSDHASLVSIETLERNGMNLDPRRYVLTNEDKNELEMLKTGTVQLKDVAKIIRAQMVRGDDHGDVFCEAGAADINKLGIVECPGKEVQLSEENPGRRYELRDRDILFAVKGSVGKVGFVEGDPKNWIAGQSFVIIRVLKNIGWPAEYVFSQLRSSAMQRYISRLSTGAVIKSLPANELNSLPLVAPTDELLSASIQKHKRRVELMQQLKRIQEEMLSLDK